MLGTLKRWDWRKVRSAAHRHLLRHARRRDLRRLLEPQLFASRWLTTAAGFLAPTGRRPASHSRGYTRLRFEPLEARRVLSANPLLPIDDFGVSGHYAGQYVQADASSESGVASNDISTFELQPPGTLVAVIDAGSLRIIDTADIANQLTLRRSGNDLVIHDAAARFVSVPPTGTLSDNDQTLTIPLADVPAFEFALADGDDQFAIDFAGGDPVPAGEFKVHGGAGSNTLQVVNGNFATITSTLLSPTSGTLSLDGAEITHHSASPVLDVGSVSDLVFQLPTHYPSRAILEDDGIAGNSLTQLRGDFSQPYFPTVTFPNPTGSLSMHRGHAASTVDIASLPDFDAAFEIGSVEAPLRNITFAGVVTLAANQSLAAHATEPILLGNSTTDLPISEVGSHIAVSGTGSVLLTSARDITLSAASITAGDGDITLSAARDVSLFGANITAADGDIMLSAARSISLSGESITSVDGDITLSAARSIRLAGASVTAVDGDITLSANHQSTFIGEERFAGISLSSATVAATGAGNIQLSGRGGTLGANNFGVYLEYGANVSANTGAVTVEGTGGTSTGDGNVGVFVRDVFASISGGGPVFVDGTGGGTEGSSGNYGVFVTNGATITGSGSDSSVTVLGTGGNSAGSGGANRGVIISSAEVTSGGGDVLVVGTGGGGGESAANQGVFVNSGKITTAGTDAALTVRGFGGNQSGTGGNDNSGVLVSGSSAVISSGTGAMLVEGTGGGSGNSSSHHGVAVTSGGRIFTEGGAAATIRGVAGTSPQSTSSRGILVTGGGSSITTAGADVELIGTSGSGTSGTGILIASAWGVAGLSDGGTISLTADSIDLLSASSIDAYNYHVQLRPLVAGTPIDLGGDDVYSDTSRTLGLTQWELNRVRAQQLTVGSADSGTLKISAPFANSSSAFLTLISGGEILFDSGSISTADLHLAATAGVRPITSGVDVTAQQITFAPDSTLRIDIDGTVPGSQYQQLRVAGGIDLSNVTLALTGNATSLSGETFKIVDNSGYEGISGHFVGLPEGGVIDDFLGSGLAATITYVGGDGNDVVLSVEHAAESDIYVTTFADVLDANDGFTSLREAIRHANLSPGHVTIHLAAGTYTLIRGIGDDTAFAGDLDIASGGTVTIVGVAAGQTVIDAAGLINPTTGLGDRVFHVLEGADLTLQSLTVTGAKIHGRGGGIMNSGHLTLADTAITGNRAIDGGGIASSGRLSISASSISENVALERGGGIHSSITSFPSELILTGSTISNNTAISGGGLWANTDTAIVDSTFVGNVASMDGGAIAQYLQTGTFTLTGSTLYQNSAARNGGGLLNTGTAVVANSTVSSNEAGNSGGGIVNSGSLTLQMSTLFGNRANSAGQTSGIGGGLRSNAAGTTLHNTLVVGNLCGPESFADDISGTLHASSSFNLISDAGTAGGLAHGTGGNRIGHAGIGTINAAEVLDPVLTDNGGPTSTHALVAGSPAIDAGNPIYPTVTRPSPWENDQRGYPRAVDGLGIGIARLDIGAYELQQPFPLTSIVVTTFVDTVNPGDKQLSLREAIILANATPGHQTIFLPAGSFTLSIAGRGENAAATGDLDITDDLTIRGAGREATIIDAVGIDRVVDVGAGVNAEFDGLSITGGSADRGDASDILEDDGGGLRIDLSSTVTIAESSLRGNLAAGSGGAVSNGGQLTILNSVLENNTAVQTGGGIYAGAGDGTTVLNSSLIGNTADAGGAIFNHRPLLIHSSTLSGNASSLAGGAINNQLGGELTLIHSTLSGNSAAGAQSGGAIINFGAANVYGSTIVNNTAGRGGGFHQSGGEARFENTIVANNIGTVVHGAPHAPDVAGTILSGGHNLIGDASGSSGFVAVGDLLQVDPLLGPLADNGGLTQTHALLAGSPAIDAGNPNFDLHTVDPPLTADQRGLARVVDATTNSTPRVDIGAYELQTSFSPLEIMVTTFDDVLHHSDGLTSLREAILQATGSTADVTIVLSAGTYALSRVGSGENAALTGDLDILAGGSVTIIGAGSGQTIVDASGLVGHTFEFGDRVFDVLTGAVLNLQDLSVTGGHLLDVDDGAGGGIRNAGQLHLQSVAVTNNAGRFGGGIRNHGTLIINASEISDNAVPVTSGMGGGISHVGVDLQISASTLAGNTANYGGGIWSNAPTTIVGSTFTANATTANGGGIVLGTGGSLTLKDSTLANNTANFGGGLLNTGSAEVINSTFSGNQARNGGGGVSSTESWGTLVIRHSTFYGNRADADGNGSGTGGGVRRGDGTITLHHTIVAGNVRGIGNTADDLTGPLTTGSSFNLVGDSATAGGLSHGASGNIVGQAGTGTLDAGTILDPVLADNGGPTWTHALLTGSLAIDAGDPNFDPNALEPPLLHDQRGDGFARVWGGRIDLGALELQRSSPPILTLPTAPVEMLEGEWMRLSDLPISVSDPDPASGELMMVFEVSEGGEFQRLSGPSQGVITLISPTRVEFTGTLDQLNHSDLSLVRFRATGGITGDTVVLDIHIADSGDPSSGVSGQFVFEASNAPPVLLPLEDRTAFIGQEVVIQGSFSDLGSLDQPWTLQVDWDGSGFVTAGTLSEQGQFTISHSYAAAGSYSVQVRVIDNDGGVSNVESFAVEVAAPAAAVVQRGLFYNGSVFGDQLDTSKQALLPGQVSSFAHYTGYMHGVTGVAIDLDGNAGTITADDLEFAIWNGIDASGFQPLMAGTSIAQVNGEGVNGSNRVRVTFANGTVVNTWLRITLKANSITGLETPDVFYFGSAVADVGVGNLPIPGPMTSVTITAQDTSAVRNNQSIIPGSAGPSNIYDLNKDGRVDAADTSVVRNYQHLFGKVNYFRAPNN